MKVLGTTIIPQFVDMTLDASIVGWIFKKLPNVSTGIHEWLNGELVLGGNLITPLVKEYYNETITVQYLYLANEGIVALLLEEKS